MTSPHLTRLERRVLLQLVEQGYIDHRAMDRRGRKSLADTIADLRKKIDPRVMEIVTVHGGGYWLERER